MPRRRLIMNLALAWATAGTSQALSITAASAMTGADWSYEGQSGPGHWGSLDPAYQTCLAGAQQSPIDLTEAQRSAHVPLMFRYRSQPFEAENTGRGVRLLSPPGSALLIRGQAHELREVSFHVPGEHRWRGAAADGEIHLLHGDMQGGLLAVAIPLRVGERENLILERILEYLPMRPGERVRQRQVGINPLFLVPTDRSYFRYTGSLTTPPCSEPVVWLVFRDALEVSAAQIQRIAMATGMNARPLQPLNGRPVFSLFRN
ncbi:MAG: carbonic anhydrase family protein [Sphingobacteriia bacterium]|nr:carbonic anhydrase family protein [Sphingobacteriia bacterium]NCC38134.1 carbonic anhydrase family protein [Gammaproteobacteria bacterium]